MRQWSLHRRFSVSVLAVTALLAALSVLVMIGFVQVNRSQARITGSLYTAVRSSAGLLNAYLDQETGLRGYALTGADAFLTPYREGLAAERTANLELDRALRTEPTPADRLARVRAVAADWHGRYAEAVLAAVRGRGPGTVPTAVQELGRQLFDRLRRAHSAFEDQLVAVRTAAVEVLDRERTLQLTAFLALALLVAGAGGWLGHALRRWVLQPLNAVRADVSRVAAGELEHPVRRVGPPELAQLGRDVERMRERIVREYTDAVGTRRTVERQREELHRQAEDLRRSNAELEQFAYVASHDLQEPLRKVASFTELLQRRYAGRLDERADSYIEFAVDGAHRMQQLINDLLEFSRVGRIGEDQRPVPLKDAAERALRNLAAAIEETGATVTLGELPTVTGEPGLLTQVFQNLIGNALKFRRPQVPPRVTVGSRRLDGDWWIDVTDNGIGIDPQYAERVFVVFSRLHRREDYPGSGIGLALAKKIVEHHGGRIRLGEHDGPGATVTFTVPVTEPQDQEGT